MASILNGLWSDLLTNFIEGNRRLKIALNPSLIGGNQALTVQPFSELNSKLGTQYETSFASVSPIVQNSSVYIVFQVGASNDVLIKDIQSQFNSTKISTALYKNPVFTGGIELPTYNLNDRDAVPDDVIITGGANITDNGVQVGPLITSLGSSTTGNRSISSIASGVGVERVLAKGVTYLYKITNLSTDATDIAGVASWYQGPLSTQEPSEG